MNQKRRQKLDQLAMEYIQERDERIFEQMYAVFNQEYRPRYDLIANSDIKNGDVSAVIAEYEDTFVATLDKFDPNKDANFSKLLVKSLSNKKIDLMRQEKTQKKYRHAPEKQKEEAADQIDPIYLVASDLNVSEYVVDKHSKQELVRYFFDKNTDPITEKIMRAIPHFDSFLAVENALGLKRHTVSRKLEKLRHLYDETLFGPHAQYLS